MSFMKLNRAPPQNEENLEEDDPFVVPDSGEETGDFKELQSPLKSTVIGDSDEESENLSKRHENDNSESRDSVTSTQDEGDNSESRDSKEEDEQFMNNSHKVSIIEHSSDSESDEEEELPKINKLKRRSIYENPSAPHTPNSNKDEQFMNNSHKVSIIEHSSDSESDEEEELPKINKLKRRSIYENPSAPHTPNSNKDEQFMKKRHKVFVIHSSDSESDEEEELPKINKLKRRSIYGNPSAPHTPNTNKSEIDKEILQLAKKEIGVGNIDPIEAQKKEYLLISIDSAQKQLDKLNKFATSIDIEKLPDKGAKVHKTIKLHQLKIAKLKADLTELSNKTQEGHETPKVIPNNVISLLSDDEDVDRRDWKNRSGIHNVKKENSKIDETKFIKKELNKVDETKFSNQFDEFDVHDIPKVPQTAFDAAELGKKALATLNKQQSLTHHRLEQLHGSLTSRPTEDQKVKDPPGLKIPLMSHQQHALAWMMWREKQKPKGGILADDMGLGKTLTMISLVLVTVNDEKHNDSSDDSSSGDEWLSRKKHKRYYGGTLVICPASLINQWEAEVKNRCKKGLLSVLVYHGNNRSLEERKLSKFNIVVTTYQIIVREANGQTGMYRMEWDRIILDEAHYIRNHKSKACLAACGLSGKRRWALTGTPIQNKEMDLYAILKFLNCSPFDDLQVWKRWVDNKNDAGKQRLVTIMKTLMLRRTKQELQAKGTLQSLPDKSLEVIEIEMDRDETLAYQKILLFSQNLFAQFLAQRAEKHHVKELYGGKFDKPSYSSLGSKTHFTKAQKVLLDHHSSNVEAHEILVLLLRLRQMCCHPALIHSMLDKGDAEMNGIDEVEETNADLLYKLQNMSINEDADIEEHVANYKIDEKVAANLLTKKNPVFDNDRCGSKVRSILSTLKEVVDKGDKMIVVSQWTSFLNVVAKHLDDIENACYAKFTGEIAVKKRQDIIDKFNDPRDGTNILLLSLTAGGVGLNLVGANHLLLIDIHWNPQLEAQAQDRIYRFGQKKDVYVYKFICKDTIEERVKNLQDKKLEIANHVLTGTRSVSSKLTIDDLKSLFS